MPATKADVEAAKKALTKLDLGDFETPNLDCISIDPVDYEAAELLFNRLAAYAGYKACAMRLRLKGDIEAALSYERLCDRIHAELPTRFRW